MKFYLAVIKSKLSYGLESLKMKQSVKEKLDRFHLKGLRKILKMKTTYVNRNNTNIEELRRANFKIAMERYQANWNWHRTTGQESRGKLNKNTGNKGMW